jgi:hypothetical protein
MATKLVRLISDKKKSTSLNNLDHSAASTSGSTLLSNPFSVFSHYYLLYKFEGKRFKDVDNEELVSDLQAKLKDLEKQNKRLKENVKNIKMKFLIVLCNKVKENERMFIWY